jgi:hypothetical protein
MTIDPSNKDRPKCYSNDHSGVVEPVEDEKSRWKGIKPLCKSPLTNKG